MAEQIRPGTEDERLAVYEREREELAAAIIKAVNGQYIGKPPPLLTGWQERAVSAVLAAGWLPPAAVQERVDAAIKPGVTRSPRELWNQLRTAALNAFAGNYGYKSWAAYANEDLAAGRSDSRAIWEVVRTAMEGVLPIVERQAAELDAALAGEARARQERDEARTEFAALNAKVVQLHEELLRENPTFPSRFRTPVQEGEQLP